MSCPVVRWQILSPKPEQSATFYERLFDWVVTRDNPLGYREVRSGATGGIEGGIWPAPPDQRGFVQLFVEVPDVEASLRKAIGLGATVLVPRSVLPDGDEMAVILDPTGMSVGLCTLRRKDR
jgi:hypothetical protein